MEFFIHNVIVPMILIGSFLSKLEGFIGDSGAKIIYSAIDKTASNPPKSKIKNVIGNCFDICFGANKGPFGFIFHIFFITLVCLLSLLSIYTYNNKGLFEQLLSMAFLRQFFFQGFFVVYIINFLMYSYYPRLKNKLYISDTKSTTHLLLQMIFLNAALFILLTVITYLIFYGLGWTGHPNISSVINSVKDVLLSAISFRNLSGVYLYSAIISLFPFFFIIFIKLLVSSDSLFRKIMTYLNWLNFKSNPLRAIIILFTLFVGVFTFFLSSILLLFTSN